MENQQELVTDSLLMEEPSIAQPEAEAQPTQTESEPQPEPQSEMSELDSLISKRTGYWPLALDLADLKWIKNSCQSKWSYTGPNEAFMLMNCYLGFSSAVARTEQAQKEGTEAGQPFLQASAIEACAMLINRAAGTGVESAQRSFRIAIALNGPIMEMKKLDDRIEQLKHSELNNIEPGPTA